MRYTKNRKVLIYFPAFYPNKIGGSEIQALRLSNELNKSGYEITFLTPWRKGMNKRFQYEQFQVYTFYTILELVKSIFKPKTNNLQNVRSSDIIFDYGSENKLYSNIRVTFFDYVNFFDYVISLLTHFSFYQKKIKLLHVNTITSIAPIFAIISKIFNKKLLVKDSTMDGIIQLHSAPFKKILRKNLVKQGYFVAMTKVIYENLLNTGIHQNKITLIPNGVQVQDSAIINYDTDPNLCLFVGNLYQQPAKGIDILIKAWSIVLKSHPKAKIIIIGSGEVDQYEEYCKKLKLNESILFKGGISPVEDYKNCSLFILPSRREGMSNSLLEAMSFGLAIVATKISGNLDLVNENENGFLVDPSDEIQLSHSIIKMLSINNYKIRFGMNNHNKITKSYTISEISNKYNLLYDKILSLK